MGNRKRCRRAEIGDVLLIEELEKSIGKQFHVVGLGQCSDEDKSKLYSLGVFPGKSFTLSQISPLGDPLIILIDDSYWAIGRSLWSSLHLIERDSI